jgi:predicted metallo-beta-lactamase superfamily hydrolase
MFDLKYKSKYSLSAKYTEILISKHVICIGSDLIYIINKQQVFRLTLVHHRPWIGFVYNNYKQKNSHSYRGNLLLMKTRRLHKNRSQKRKPELYHNR